MTEEEYKKDFKDLEEEFNLAKNELVRKYKNANAKYKVGDILQDHLSVIKVDVIRSYRMFEGDVPRITYHGPELRKKDYKPKVNGAIYTIYEDSVIKKI